MNHYHVLTNERLNEAVVITRSTPGPVGLYIVSVGYLADGLPGAVAGWLPMITPALLVIPMVHFIGRRMEHPRVRSVLRTVVIASAGLLPAAFRQGSKGKLACSVTVPLSDKNILFSDSAQDTRRRLVRRTDASSSK